MVKTASTAGFTSFTYGNGLENFKYLSFLNHMAQGYKNWHVASSNRLLQKLLHYSPWVKIGTAKGSQVLHRPLMPTIVKMCPRFLSCA